MAATLQQTLSDFALMKEQPEQGFWRKLLCTPFTVDEIFQGISRESILELHTLKPHLLGTFMFHCIEQLALFGRYTESYFVPAKSSLRFLARLIPVVLETGAFQENFFWNNKVIFGGKEYIFDKLGGQPLESPVGQVLMEAINAAALKGGFAFIPGANLLSFPEFSTEHAFLQPRFLWTSGLGAEAQVNGRDATVDENRLDILMCLLACCTESLYSEDTHTKNKFVEALLGTVNHNNVSLCYSLLNTALSYDPSGSLPYTSYWTDSQEQVVKTSLRVLLALLDYGTWASAEKPGAQAFWSVLQGLTSTKDLTFVATGFLRLAGNRLKAASTYLPMSQKELDFHAVVLMFLLKMLQVNSQLCSVLCRQQLFPDTLSTLVFILFEDCTQKRGLLKVVVAVLLFLSQKSEFGTSLSLPFSSYLPTTLPAFTGNHFDLLVLVFQYVINLNEDWLSGVYEPLWCILYNVTPYTKLSSTVASSKLVSIVHVFSQPKVIAKDQERAIRHLKSAVEVIHTLLAHSYKGNLVLVYALLNDVQTFQVLAAEIESKDGTPGILQQLKEDLPLELIMRILVKLGPMLKEHCAATKSSTEADALQFLSRVAITNFPDPATFVTRFPETACPLDLVTAWTWNVLFVSQQPMLWNLDRVRVFKPKMIPGTMVKRVQLPAGAGAAATLHHCLRELQDKEVDKEDDEFWKVLFLPANSKVTCEEVRQALPRASLRTLRDTRPVALATFVFKCVEQVVAFAGYDKGNYISICNALRFLTRLLPIALEFEEGGKKNFGDVLFWENQVVDVDGTVHKFDAMGGETLTVNLGNLLMAALCSCGVHSGFTFLPSARSVTLPSSALGNTLANPRWLWSGGILVNDAGNARDATVDEQRLDILRCLLACFVQTVYSENHTMKDRFIQALTSESNANNVTLCFSLLSTALSYDPSGSLPYSSYWTDSQEEVVSTCLQVLLAVLDYSSWEENPNGGPTYQEQKPHAFWSVLKELHMEKDLVFIAMGLLRLAGNPFKAAHTYLPMSQKQLDFQGLVILFLFKLLQVNTLLVPVLCNQSLFGEMITSLVHTLLAEVNTPSANVRVIVMILVQLSYHSEFGTSLNAPFVQFAIPSLPAFTGNHFDLLMIVIHYMINLNADYLWPLYKDLMTILYNVSPYVKLTSNVACGKLLSLIHVFSQDKAFNQGVEGPTTVLIGALETLASLINSDYKGNINVIYIMVREQDTFSKLHALCEADTSDNSSSTSTLEKHPLASHKDQLSQILLLPMRVLKTLEPMLKKFCEETSRNDTECLAYLQRIQISNMPPAGPFKPRIGGFQIGGGQIQRWTWLVICARRTQLDTFDFARIKLFKIHEQVRIAAAQQDATEAQDMNANMSTPFTFTHTAAFEALLTRQVGLDETDFWKHFFCIPITFSAISEGLPMPSLQRLKEKRPLNFGILIFKAIEQIFLFQDYDGDFYNPALNALRFLSVLMPVALSPQETEQGFSHEFSERLFWSNKVTDADGQEYLFATMGPNELKLNLGTIMMISIRQALLHPGFACPAKLKPVVKNGVYINFLWAPGLICPEGVTESSEWDVVRVDGMRCLVACLTSTIYGTDCLQPNKFLKVLTTPSEDKYSPTLLVSLLNSALSYDPAGALPYFSYMTDTREEVATWSLMTLCALFGYDHLFTVTDEGKYVVAEPPPPTEFWRTLGTLATASDMSFLCQGFVNLLSNKYKALNSYLPYSQKECDFHGFAGALLDSCFKGCIRFRAALANHKEALTQLVPTLMLMVGEGTSPETNPPGSNLTVFPALRCLLGLYTQPGFSGFMNGACERQPFNRINNEGNYHDQLISAMYILMTSIPSYQPMGPVFINIIYNLSFNCKSLSLRSAKEILHIGVSAINSVDQQANCSPTEEVCAVMMMTAVNNLLLGSRKNNAVMLFMIKQAHFGTFLRNLRPETAAKIPSTKALEIMGKVIPMLSEFQDKNPNADGNALFLFFQEYANKYATNVGEPLEYKPMKPGDIAAELRRVSRWTWHQLFTRNTTVFPTTGIRVFQVFTS